MNESCDAMSEPRWTRVPTIHGWYLLSTHNPPTPAGATVLRVSRNDVEEQLRFAGMLYGPIPEGEV